MQKTNKEIKIMSKEVEGSTEEFETSGLVELISELLVEYWIRHKTNE